MQRGISGNEQHPTDWEQQQERLSAYLDDALEPAERAELESHLAGCVACQDGLTDLRDLRSLLRALPTPTPPRSFLLSDDGAVPVQLSPRRETTLVHGRTARRGPHVAEWAGALVASVGLALLFTSALVGHGGTSASTASAPLGSNNQTSQTAAGSPKASTGTADQSRTPGTAPGTAFGTETSSTQTATASTPNPTPLSNRNNDKQESPTVEGVPPILPISGAGLFVGGAVVFVVRRATSRRRTAD